MRTKWENGSFMSEIGSENVLWWDTLDGRYRVELIEDNESYKLEIFDHVLGDTLIDSNVWTLKQYPYYGLDLDDMLPIWEYCEDFVDNKYAPVAQSVEASVSKAD